MKHHSTSCTFHQVMVDFISLDNSILACFSPKNCTHKISESILFLISYIIMLYRIFVHSAHLNHTNNTDVSHSKLIVNQVGFMQIKIRISTYAR